MTPSLRRRRFLGLTGGASIAGLAALAGCTVRLPGTGPTTIDVERFREQSDRPVPSVERTLPIEVESAKVDELRDRAEGYMADVPAPFDAESIPNGAIRERLNRLYDRARDRLRSATDDGSAGYHRLHDAADAVSAAREVRGAWRAADEDLTVEDVLERASDVNDALDAFASRREYVVGDPLDGLVLHHAVERLLDTARRSVSHGPPRYEPNPFGVGEAAGAIADGRVSVELAAYCYDRYREGLSNETAFGPQFDDVRQTLGGLVDREQSGLPTVDSEQRPDGLLERDVGETAGTHALEDLWRRATASRGDAATNEFPDDRTAVAIVAAHDDLVAIGAFESLRDRIEGGDDLAVRSADDLASMRTRAVSALDEAAATQDAPSLASLALSGQDWRVRRADDGLGDREELSARAARYDASLYVEVAETCLAVPDANRQVVTKFERARNAG